MLTVKAHRPNPEYLYHAKELHREKGKIKALSVLVLVWLVSLLLGWQLITSVVVVGPFIKKHPYVSVGVMVAVLVILFGKAIAGYKYHKRRLDELPDILRDPKNCPHLLTYIKGNGEYCWDCGKCLRVG